MGARACRPTQSLGAADRRGLTSLLWEGCLSAHGEVYAHFVTRKLLTLAVHVACMDWGAGGGALLGTVGQLLAAATRPAAVALGVAAATTLLEEATGRPPAMVASGLVTGAAAAGVREALTAALPQLTAAASGVLATAAAGGFPGVAPPPASLTPLTAGGGGAAVQVPVGLFSGTTDGTSVNHKLARAALQLLAALLGEWGLGAHLPADTLRTLLALTTAGLRTPSSSSLATDVTVAAVGVLVDIVRTPAVPREHAALFADIAAHMLKGAEALLGAGSGPVPLSTLPEGVVDKFAEFVGTFLQYHVARLEALPRFAMPDFVRVFFALTVALADAPAGAGEGYLSCLAGWSALIEHLADASTAGPGAGGASPLATSLYVEALGSLATQLLDRVQFARNGDTLAMLGGGEGEDGASAAGSVSTVATTGSVLAALGGRSGAATPPKRGGPPRGGGGSSASSCPFGSLLEESDELEEGGVQRVARGNAVGGGDAGGSAGEGAGVVAAVLDAVLGAGPAARSELDAFLAQCLGLLGRIGRLPAVTAALVSAVLQRLQAVAPVATEAVAGGRAEEVAQWAVYDTSTLCALMAALAHVWTSHDVAASPAAQATAGEVLQLTAGLGAAVGRALAARSAAGGAAPGGLPAHLLRRLQRACFTALLGMLPWLDAHLPRAGTGAGAGGGALSDAVADAVLSDIVALVVAAVDTRGAVAPPADTSIAAAVTLFSALTLRSAAFTARCTRLPLVAQLVTGLADITAALPTDAQAHLVAAACRLLVAGAAEGRASPAAQGEAAVAALSTALAPFTSPLSKLAAAAGTGGLQAAVAADRSLPAQVKRSCTILVAVARALGGAAPSATLRQHLRSLFLPVLAVLEGAVVVLLAPETSAALMARRGRGAGAPPAPASIAVTCLNTTASALRLLGVALETLGPASRDAPLATATAVARPVVAALHSGLLRPSAPDGSGSFAATRVLLAFLRLLRTAASVGGAKRATSAAMVTLVLQALTSSGLLALVEGPGGPHMDLAPALHLLLRVVLDTHWQAVTADATVAAGAAAALTTVQASMTAPGVPPALLRLHLVTLHELQVRHRAFALPALGALLPALTALLLRLLLAKEAALLEEEVHASLWELVRAASSPGDAILAAVRAVLGGMQWLKTEHAGALEGAAAATVAAAAAGDATAFGAAVQGMCNDLRVWAAGVGAS